MIKIIVPHKIKIAATLVVRDEADILEPMLAHHIEEGVTHIFVTNNNSKDATKRILSRFPEVVEVIESTDMTHNQEAHTTRMARTACGVSPDWIVHLDADEFWCDLDAMERFSGDVAFITRCYVHPPVSGIGPGPAPLDRMKRYIDFHGFTREFKVIHRPDPEIVVKHGNHEVYGLGPAVEYHGCHRHHYPIRSFTQFERKVIQGTVALQTRGFSCKRWDDWYDESKRGNLMSVYQRLCGQWERYNEGDIPSRNELRDILLNGYKVDQRSVDGALKGLDREGLQPVIRFWIPESFQKRKVY